MAKLTRKSFQSYKLKGLLYTLCPEYAEYVNANTLKVSEVINIYSIFNKLLDILNSKREYPYTLEELYRTLEDSRRYRFISGKYAYCSFNVVASYDKPYLVWFMDTDEFKDLPEDAKKEIQLSLITNINDNSE